jgi:hypothetical protein
MKKDAGLSKARREIVTALQKFSDAEQATSATPHRSMLKKCD